MMTSNSLAVPLLSPNFLSIDYRNFESMRTSILDTYFESLDLVKPTCRFRGTIIDCRELTSNRIHFLTWQRTVSRVQKLDVSLPTIVRVTINQHEEIEHIDLDECFTGSKGLYCSRKYLERNMIEKIMGAKLDRSFFNKVKIDNLHCYHLFEVLSAIGSFYSITKSKLEGRFQPELYIEEEVGDSYTEGDDVIDCGKQKFWEKTSDFGIRYRDVLKHVSFNKNGQLDVSHPIRAEFSLDGELKVEKTILIKPENHYMDLQKFLFKCITFLRKQMAPEATKFYNTNLFPLAYIGLIVKGHAIRFFEDNYAYVNHVLTATQRHGNVPKCIGAIKGFEEAGKFFPNYTAADLI